MLTAKLILYPQYPEVRFSGFIRGARYAPTELLTTRQPGRLLFFGITFNRRIIGWCAGPHSKLARALPALDHLEALGVFRRIPLTVRTKSTRAILLEQLLRIHRKDWIVSKSLQADSRIVPCRASNCIGYTLEAELGVARNGRAEPDFEGWEVKANQVSNLAGVPPSKVVTLMTPEPTGGVYRDDGVESFIRRFGYPDRRGRANRINFGGVHRVNQRHSGTGLTLVLNGYDHSKGRVTDPEGSLLLVDDYDTIAASWSFSRLLGIWSRKHAQAVYVPGEVKRVPQREYRYGSTVRLGEGTSFNHLVGALAKGDIYYDPGIKLEDEASSNPTSKKRSQFRIKWGNMADLYDHMEKHDLMST